jgi:hypothetical protein
MKICFRCGKQFYNKSSLNRHLKNENICQAKYLDISPDEIILNYKIYTQEYNEIAEENMAEESNVKTYTCKHCDKKFTYKRSYTRHYNEYCKAKKAFDENQKIMDEFLNTKYKLLKLELEKSKDEYIKENLELKETFEKKIKELEAKMLPYTTQNNINNGSINNGHIGDNITIINNFGEEKFNINAEDCEKIMSHEFNMIVKLIEYIHILLPENRNSFIPSLKEKYAMILRDQKWNLVDRTEFINNLVISKNVMLEELIDKYGDQFKTVNSKRSRSIINYCKNDEEEYKKIKTEASLLLFNNKDLIKNTFKFKYQKKVQLG